MSLDLPPEPVDQQARITWIRSQFPALRQEVHGKRLVYLDSAATALKPTCVIDAVRDIWERDCANIHRGVHTLSQRATQRYEDARSRIGRFIGATDRREVIFVRGATEGINLVAQSFAIPRLGPGDEILITGLEHHANIVPWQVVRDRTGATLKIVPVTEAGEVSLAALDEQLTRRTKVLAFAHVSNALGTVLPAKEMIARAHAVGAVVVVDGAQAVPHLPVDVKDLGCDFYVFSGHKLYGPDGTGILYARREWLEQMAPYQTGGDMILSVSFEETLYNELPARFEAGTPNISGAVGLGAAVDFVSGIGFEWITRHEQDLLQLAQREFSHIAGLRQIGTAPNKVGVLSFVLDGIHAHDIGTVLDTLGIAIRTGHHCAQPVVERMGLAATARASLGLYTDERDILDLMAAIGRVKEMFD
ncbi:MAG TPA: SufS family cysteine desulfurase [Polyangiaceae bacterium]